jgi:hypothetical protein
MAGKELDGNFGWVAAAGAVISQQTPGPNRKAKATAFILALAGLKKALVA